MTNARVVDQVQRWRDELLTLTRRSNLLYFKHLKVGTLEIAAPDLFLIFSHLGVTGFEGWYFRAPHEPNEEAQTSRTTEVLPAPATTGQERRASDSWPVLLSTKTTARDLAATLRSLHRASTQEFLDKGTWTLHLGIGMLEWVDPEDDVRASSPLLLVPVKLERETPREPFRLIAADGEVVFNPGLTRKLKTDFGIALPSDPTGSLEDIFAGVGRAIAEQNGWELRQHVVLARFSFQKEVMYQDLLENEEMICAHPLVMALASEPSDASSSSFGFDPMPEGELDERVPPEDHPTVLDADASQRQCVEAAARGMSFVMDGPPGTGKSQTITNIIAELLRIGRSVLFVSEKAAALDVVKKRLSEVGLSDYLLALGDSSIKPKDVAVALGNSLQMRQELQTTVGPIHLQALRTRRRELSAYAAALNEVRQPLGRSLHEVIGRVLSLQEHPQAPVAAALANDLSVGSLTHIIDLSERLSRAWGPVEREPEFLWRDVSADTFDASAHRRCRDEATAALRALENLRSVSGSAAREIGFDEPRNTSEAEHVFAIAALLAQRPTLPMSWLQAEELDTVVHRIADLRDRAQLLERAQGVLEELVGSRWTELDRDELDQAVFATDRLAELMPGTAELLEASSSELECLRSACAELEGLTPELADAGARIAESFGVSSEGLTVQRCVELATLAKLATVPHKPLRTWLNPALFSQLEDARQRLGRLAAAFAARRNTLSAIYEDSIVTLDLDGLTTRFETVHKGIGKLHRSYREDKATLLPHLRARRITPEALANLQAAREWQQLDRELNRGERQHAGILGAYYEGVETDFAVIDEALAVARRALDLVGRDLDVGRLGESLTAPDANTFADARDMEQLRARFTTAIASLRPSFAAALAPLPLTSLAALTKSAPLLLAAITKGLDQAQMLVGKPLRARELAQIAHRVVQAVDAHAAFAKSEIADREALGAAFTGLATDWDTLATMLTRAVTLRGVLGAPVRRDHAEQLVSADISCDDLRDALEAWERGAAQLLENFDAPYAASLSHRLQMGFEQAALLLHGLESTVDDVNEWFAFTEARAQLAACGLSAQIDSCMQQRLEAASLPAVIERSVLEAFVDDVMRSDSRLETFRLVDRDALVSEFVELDRQLFKFASAQVIAACNARRPQMIGVGQSAVIRREVEKQRRHMPIRNLLLQTADLAKALKPCFMMSPLTVSQFLAPGMSFDAVIFDEASQVRPADAVNAIYRGTQLIVAGDQRQLPPSSFFESTEAESDEYEEGQLEDFESLLDLAKGQGNLVGLPLRWHYRSQHEALITFSNYSFYDGRLVTFPSALQDGPDVGIELFKVKGVYRRGAARDNPVEAETVVDRVVAHLREHPELTLGVVAFSEAQATAIETALERRRRELPELDHFFGEDRLRGVFVKNLESVQGDERDTIIFSIGYGPDEVGKFTLNFGPLNRTGGERRLNVAITRARRRVEIVSSITASDFTGQSTSAGVTHLRRYLDFAEHGIAALSLEVGEGDRDMESPFEEEVARVLRRWGYDVVPQVGQAGYRIDLGVRDPEKPGSFLLGIECDGARYHSSKVARDRDRLRHEQLENLGWNLHHIWGTAWYRERRHAEEELRRALDDAPHRARRTPQAPIALPVTAKLAPTTADGPASWTVPYEAARLDLATQGMEMSSLTARPMLLEAVAEVVLDEAPVHKEIVLRRIREAWGVGRSGAVIQNSFDSVLRESIDNGVLSMDEAGFLFISDLPRTTVRVPAPGIPESMRKVEHVPMAELELALLEVVYNAKSLTYEELYRVTARVFGWNRTGDVITLRLREALNRLASKGKVSLDARTVQAVT